MASPRHELNERQKHHEVASEDEVSHSSSPTRPTATRRKTLLEWPWILECLFLALAIGALVALVIVILRVKDESLGSWRDRHPHISINTIVAILSTLLAGSCMGQVMGQSKWQWFREPHSLADFARVDRASRGPWGSLLLLCRLRAPTLARVAAITTLVAVAVNPFAQNIIATRECQVASTDEEITIPTADDYGQYQNGKPRNTNPAPGDFSLWGIDSAVPRTAIKASVYSGIWDALTTAINGSTIALPPSNIPERYPRYSTLGVCHQCADISSSVEKVCDSTIAEDNDGVFTPQCKWSLPTGQTLHNYANSDTYLNRNFSDVSMNYAIVNSTSQLIALPHTPGTFTNVTFLVNTTADPECTTNRGNNCGNWMGVPTMELNTIAAECSLFPCTRTYTASIVNGTLIETEVQRTLSTANDWLDYDGLGSDWRKGPTIDQIAISPAENCTHYKPDWTGERYDRTGDGPFSARCTFTASATFIMSLGDFFWGFWNGTVAGRHWQDSYATNDILDAFWGQGITNFTHIDGVIGGLADSMTMAIRRTGRVHERDSFGEEQGQGLVSGRVLRTETCFELRWGWIAVPAVVVVATAVLLLWAIVGSRAATGRPIWKASTLPVLFHGPHTTSLVGGNMLLTVKEMENKASGMVVKLPDGAAGNARLETCSS